MVHELVWILRIELNYCPDVLVYATQPFRECCMNPALTWSIYFPKNVIGLYPRKPTLIFDYWGSRLGTASQTSQLRQATIKDSW